MNLFEDAMALSQEAQSKISQLVNEVDELEHELAAAESMVETYRKRLNKLKTEELPQAMGEAQVEQIKTKQGLVLTRKYIVSGTWPSEPEEITKALDWLKENNAEDLVKCQVLVEFDRGHREEANSFFSVAASNNAKKSAKLKETVHHQTLNAFFRECLKENKSVPLDLFNGYAAWHVDIKRKP